MPSKRGEQRRGAQRQREHRRERRDGESARSPNGHKTSSTHLPSPVRTRHLHPTLERFGDAATPRRQGATPPRRPAPAQTANPPVSRRQARCATMGRMPAVREHEDTRGFATDRVCREEGMCRRGREWASLLSRPCKTSGEVPGTRPSRNRWGVGE